MPSKTVQAVSAAASLALAACASQPTAVAASQQAPTASASGAGSHRSALPKSRLSAFELGQRLLKLVVDLHSIDDLTLTRVEEAIGVKLKYAEGLKADFVAEELEDGWHYMLTFRERTEEVGPQFQFEFANRTDEFGAITPVCIDFERFSDALTASGYRRSEHYAQEEVLMDWDFVRQEPFGPMTVHINSRDESHTDKALQRECIKWIIIN